MHGRQPLLAGWRNRWRPQLSLAAPRIIWEGYLARPSSATCSPPADIDIDGTPTPVRHAVESWIAAVAQGGTARVEGVWY
jgi:hypothetical protein